MTFCLGIIVHEGIIGLADSRLTSGNEIITAKKLNLFHLDQGAFFIMTSGLRSVRDKALTYFDEAMRNRTEPVDRLFKVVNMFASQIRQVSKEDKESLKGGGFDFEVNVIVGGQMMQDREHMLYLIYPEGNWVEVGKGTPYQIIGSPAYGKPVLDRTLQYDDSRFDSYQRR